MRAAVVLPGTAPRWIDLHARQLAHRLSVNGDVLLVDSTARDLERMLPGELARSTVLGISSAGHPLWTAGRPAAFGFRGRRDLSIIVLWPTASITMAVISAAVSRCRGEQVVVHQEASHLRSRSIVRRCGERVLAMLARTIVDLGGPEREVTNARTVLAVCGDDAVFARTMVAAMNSLSDSISGEWRLRLHVSPSVGTDVLDRVRSGRDVTLEVGKPVAAEIAGAELVVASHGHPGASKVEQAVSSGGAGVIIGHPVAGRIARRADGVWLAAAEPSAVVVAMESATGSVRDSPVSVERLRQAGDAVLAEVASIA